MTISLFGKTMDLIEKALNIRSKIHQTTVSNIANQNTPNYKARFVDFNKALKGASGSNTVLPMTHTNPNHIRTHNNGNTSIDLQEIIQDGPSGPDGNSVNIENEMARMAHNSLLYNTTIQIIASRFNGLKNVIREGR